MYRLISYISERRSIEPRWHQSLVRLQDSSQAVRCHLVWGTADRVAPPAIATALADMLRGAKEGCEVRFMEGVGHFGMLEADGDWARQISSFIQKK